MEADIHEFITSLNLQWFYGWLKDSHFLLDDIQSNLPDHACVLYTYFYACIPVWEKYLCA